jgi:hypothetical protein
MAGKPTQEFGRRRPAVVSPAPPVKRSGHVALLLMGTFAIGGTAYALMPRANCEPNGPGMASASTPQTATNCGSSGSSFGGHGSSGSSWSRSNFYGGDSTANRSSSGGPLDSGSSGVTRGGFGSFARAFSAHFSGGG